MRPIACTELHNVTYYKNTYTIHLHFIIRNAIAIVQIYIYGYNGGGGEFGTVKLSVYVYEEFVNREQY